MWPPSCSRKERKFPFDLKILPEPFFPKLRLKRKGSQSLSLFLNGDFRETRNRKIIYLLLAMYLTLVVLFSSIR